MNKKVIMAIAVPLIAVVLCAIIGTSCVLLTNKNHEQANDDEQIIQPEDELGDVAMMKIRDAWCRQNCEMEEMRDG